MKHQRQDKGNSGQPSAPSGEDSLAQRLLKLEHSVPWHLYSPDVLQTFRDRIELLGLLWNGCVLEDFPDYYNDIEKSWRTEEMLDDLRSAIAGSDMLAFLDKCMAIKRRDYPDDARLITMLRPHEDSQNRKVRLRYCFRDTTDGGATLKEVKEELTVPIPPSGRLDPTAGIMASLVLPEVQFVRTPAHEAPLSASIIAIAQALFDELAPRMDDALNEKLLRLAAVAWNEAIYAALPYPPILRVEPYHLTHLREAPPTTTERRWLSMMRLEKRKLYPNDMRVVMTVMINDEGDGLRFVVTHERSPSSLETPPAP